MTATRSRAGFPAFHLVKRAKSRRFVTVIINGGDASEDEPRSAVGGGWLRLGSRKLAAGTRRGQGRRQRRTRGPNGYRSAPRPPTAAPGRRQADGRSKVREVTAHASG